MGLSVPCLPHRQGPIILALPAAPHATPRARLRHGCANARAEAEGTAHGARAPHRRTGFYGTASLAPCPCHGPPLARCGSRATGTRNTFA